MRNDNDSWDITTSVGSTALFVAAARALEARKPAPVAVDPYAEVFCRAAGDEWAGAVDGDPENILASEFGRHFVNFQAVRTRYFDSYFGSAAAAGIRQIVILAAGLDSRAYRLAWPAETVVFELDQPRVLEFKREVLVRHGATALAERREIAVDLRDDWPHALTGSGFDPSRPSAWLAEGLLIYLPATAQGQLFGGIDASACAGSQVAVEESVPMPAEAFEARRGEAEGPTAIVCAPRVRSAFFNLVYNEQCAPAAEWFSHRGWTAVATPIAVCLQQAGRPIPGRDTDEAHMIDALTLVSAQKA